MARARAGIPNIDYVAAGKLVRIARQELGMTLRQFGEAAGYLDIWAIEAGRRPRPRTIARICAVLPELWRPRVWEAYGYPGTPTRIAGYEPQFVVQRIRAEMGVWSADLGEEVGRGPYYLKKFEIGNTSNAAEIHNLTRFFPPAWRLACKYAHADRGPSYEENPAGFVLRRARFDTGLRNSALSQRLDVSHGQVTNIETGKGRWSVGSLTTLCNALPRWRSPLLIAAGYRRDPENDQLLGPMFLREERRRHHLTITELGRRTHIRPARLRAAELGHPLTVEELSTVARELITPVELFLTGFDLDDSEFVALRKVGRPTGPRSERPPHLRTQAEQQPQLIAEQVRPINRGDVIRQARDALGLSRRGLARTTGLSYSIFAQAENGGGLLPQTIHRICQSLPPYWRKPSLGRL